MNVTSKASYRELLVLVSVYDESSTVLRDRDDQPLVIIWHPTGGYWTVYLSTTDDDTERTPPRVHSVVKKRTRRGWFLDILTVIAVAMLAVGLFLLGGALLGDEPAKRSDSVTRELSLFPPCVEEDDPWCTLRNGEETYINLSPADPAPVTLKVELLP